MVYPTEYFKLVSPWSLVNNKLSSVFVYKLYPDVVVFYSFIIGVTLMATAAHMFPRVRRILHARFWVSQMFMLRLYMISGVEGWEKTFLECAFNLSPNPESSVYEMERLYTSGYSYGTIHFILFILFFNIYISCSLMIFLFLLTLFCLLNTRISFRCQEAAQQGSRT